MSLDISVREIKQRRIGGNADRRYRAVIEDNGREVYRSNPMTKEEVQADAMLAAARYEGRPINLEALRPVRPKRVSKRDPQEEEMFPETRAKGRKRARAPRMS